MNEPVNKPSTVKCRRFWTRGVPVVLAIAILLFLISLPFGNCQWTRFHYMFQAYVWPKAELRFLPDGYEPDPYAELPKDVYFIERKETENKNIIKYQLSTALDLEGVKLPKRTIISDKCVWQYRGIGCWYQHATGTDNFDKMFNGVKELLDAGYRKIFLKYLIAAKTAVDAEKFCKFIEKYPGIKATVLNNVFEGRRFYNLMKTLEHQFAHLSDRVAFRYRDQGLGNKFSRVLNLPRHFLRYACWRKG